MQNNNQPLTRQQFAAQIGVSYTTLWRRLRKINLELPSGLLFPDDQHRICEALGIPAQGNERL